MDSKQIIQSEAPAKMARQMCALRHKKIQNLKTKITSGKYRIDNMSLAKALFLAR